MGSDSCSVRSNSHGMQGICHKLSDILKSLYYIKANEEGVKINSVKEKVWNKGPSDKGYDSNFHYNFKEYDSNNFSSPISKVECSISRGKSYNKLDRSKYSDKLSASDTSISKSETHVEEKSDASSVASCIQLCYQDRMCEKVKTGKESVIDKKTNSKSVKSNKAIYDSVSNMCDRQLSRGHFTENNTEMKRRRSNGARLLARKANLKDTVVQSNVESIPNILDEFNEYHIGKIDKQQLPFQHYNHESPCCSSPSNKSCMRLNSPRNAKAYLGKNNSYLPFPKASNYNKKFQTILNKFESTQITNDKLKDHKNNIKLRSENYKNNKSSFCDHAGSCEYKKTSSKPQTNLNTMEGCFKRPIFYEANRRDDANEEKHTGMKQCRAGSGNNIKGFGSKETFEAINEKLKEREGSKHIQQVSNSNPEIMKAVLPYKKHIKVVETLLSESTMQISTLEHLLEAQRKKEEKAIKVISHINSKYSSLKKEYSKLKDEIIKLKSIILDPGELKRYINREILNKKQVKNLKNP